MPSLTNLKKAVVTISKDHHIDYFLDLGIYGAAVTAVNSGTDFPDFSPTVV